MKQPALPKTAIVIGAGIGGLAIANLLAKRGVAVNVYEKNDQPGGRAGRLDVDGFRFDTGPSWYLMPEVFEHYFELLDEDINKYLELIRLDPGYKVTYSNSQSINIHGDETKDAASFESIEPGSASRLASYLNQAQRTYELATKYFLYNNFDAWSGILKREVAAAGPAMATTARKTIDQNVRSYVHDPRLQKVLEYPSVFLGASPFTAPAIYSLMSHMDFKQGVFYPQGGMYEIIEALLTIGKKLGVRYEFGTPVAAITTATQTVTGIRLESGEEQLADIVISNADLHHTETSLLPADLQTYPVSYWAKKQVGPSALLLYLGVKGSLPDFEHHNLLFADVWQSSFTDIFTNKLWPQPASIYVCVPSKTDPSVAPKGYENVFVLVPGPADETITDKQLQKLADGYIDQIAKTCKVPDLKQRIVVQRLFGPKDFATQFNSWQGTALGLSHTLRQSAMFRPKNVSRKVSGLYYVGANTVPGIGLPMCLIGAELVLKRIIGDKTSGPLPVVKRKTGKG